MKPVLKIGEHDYTPWLEDLAPVRNDMDSEESGRDIGTGEMFRVRIAKKDKWSAKFLQMPEEVVRQLSVDLDPVFVRITVLHPHLNRIVTKTYYVSTLTYGSQRYKKSDGITVYDGCTFNMTEK